MAIHKQQTGRATSTPKGLMIGLTASLVITVICAAILAKMIDTEILVWENTGYWIIPILVFSSFIGSSLSFKKIQRQRMLICLSSGMLYWTVLVVITALFFGGQFEAVAVTAGLIAAGSFSAFLLNTPKASHRKQRNHRIRTR